MFKIARLLDSAKLGASIDSDYRLAKVIGITHAAVSGYRMGKALPKDKVIAQLCAMSGDDPHLMLAQIQLERASSPEAKGLWESLALRLAASDRRVVSRVQTAILSVCFAIGLIAVSTDDARAGDGQPSKTALVSCLYIVCDAFLSVCVSIERRLRRWPQMCAIVPLWRFVT